MQGISFDELRATIAAMPDCDRTIAAAAAARLNGQRDGDIAAWLAGVQRRQSPRIVRPRVAIYAAAHGINADLAGGRPDDVAQQVQDMLSGGGAVHARIEAIDGELKLYELSVERPTHDARLIPAMTEGEAALAAAYGMTSVEEGVDVLVVASLGQAGDVAALTLACALFPSLQASHEPRIAAALARHAGLTDPLALLAALGGPDIAAIFGAIVAARFAGVPVILDGPSALAAASVAFRLRPDALDHCRAAGSVPWAKFLPLGALRSEETETPLAGIAAVPVLEAACRLLG